MIKILKPFALVGTAAALLSGCASPSTGNPTPAVTTVVVTVTAPPGETTPAATTPATTAPTEAPVLADGKSPVYITSVNASKRTLTFDLILFLTGDEAKAEWKKEGKDVETGDATPPNDYMIVNNNPKLRTLPVSTTAAITYNDPDNSFAPKSTTLSKLVGPFTYRPFWLTVKGGVIIKIEEQFVP